MAFFNATPKDPGALPVCLPLPHASCTYLCTYVACAREASALQLCSPSTADREGLGSRSPIQDSTRHGFAPPSSQVAQRLDAKPLGCAVLHPSAASATLEYNLTLPSSCGDADGQDPGRALRQEVLFYTFPPPALFVPFRTPAPRRERLLSDPPSLAQPHPALDLCSSPPSSHRASFSRSCIRRASPRKLRRFFAAGLDAALRNHGRVEHEQAP